MKQFLHLLLVFSSFCFSTISHAQYLENFTSTPIGSFPAGWNVAPNTGVTTYKRPGTCSVTDKGIQTPGVGTDAPAGFLLPAQSYDPASNDISVRFSVFVYDAAFTCSTLKSLSCSTYVTAYIVPVSWNDPLGTPTPAQYFAALPAYEIMYANTSNLIAFTNVSLPAGVTNYRILLQFTTADGSTCSSGDTKFIFDDFSVTTADCNNCAPVASADYFNADAQNLFTGGATSFKGNVFGGYALWAGQALGGYTTSSLTYTPAQNNGTDYDLNNSNLFTATFMLASSLVVEASTPGCVNPLPGTIRLNSNGTFIYTIGSACVKRVSFTYMLMLNPYGTTAPTKVTIDLPGQEIILPVTFKYFTATRDVDNVALNWETATERNNKGFYVQRSLGREWKDVAFVNAQSQNGNSSSALNYSFTDLNLYKGITHYRILQVDMDNKNRYSETRSVRGRATSAKLLLFPNPSTTGAVTLLFNSEGAKSVTVTDISGRVVKQYRNVTANSLDITGLSNGFYTVLVTGNAAGATEVEKFIIRQ